MVQQILYVGVALTVVLSQKIESAFLSVISGAVRYTDHCSLLLFVGALLVADYKPYGTEEIIQLICIL